MAIHCRTCQLSNGETHEMAHPARFKLESKERLRRLL
jgi:rRNA maturation protein Nop10